MSNIDPNEPVGVRQQREHIERLEAQLAEQAERDAAAAVAIRENALLRAGVALDTPLGAMFAKGYDGELQVDAIKAAAEAVGALTIPGEPTPVVDTPPDPTAVEVQAQRAQLAAETEPAGTLPEGDPILGAYGRFHQEMRDGKTREEAAPAVLGEIIAQANDGNPKFLVKPGPPIQA